MGVTWHGNYFRYLERARCRLLEKIGYGYRTMIESGYSWPIVDTRVKFTRTTVFQAAYSCRRDARRIRESA